MVVFVRQEEMPDGKLAVQITLPAEISERVKRGVQHYVGVEFESKPHRESEDVVHHIINPSEFEGLCELLEKLYNQPTVLCGAQGTLNSETVGTSAGHENTHPDLLVPTYPPTLRAQAYVSDEGPGIYFSFCSPHFRVEEYLKKEVRRPTGRARRMRDHHTNLREMFLPTQRVPRVGEVHGVVERAVAAYGKDISWFVYAATKKI